MSVQRRLCVPVSPSPIYPEYQSGSFAHTLEPLSIYCVAAYDASLGNIDRRCNFGPIGLAG